MNSPLAGKVRELAGAVLQKPIAPGENVSRASESAWDSLKHIELIFLLEDHFGVRFSEQELAEITDLHQMTSALEAKIAAQHRS